MEKIMKHNEQEKQVVDYLNKLIDRIKNSYYIYNATLTEESTQDCITGFENYKEITLSLKIKEK